MECPVCNAALDLDEDELDEGDEFTCEECGAELAVTSKEPLEIEPVSDAEDDDEDEDEEDVEEEEEDEDLDEEEEESEEWK
ncbi:MAG: hypothetical protein H7039_08335 [Bryobacteraceae bacterium]|nr:hypothetical protein [Bryobacteraceae bacterium]